MGEVMRKVITGVLAAVFLCSTAMVILQALDKREAADAYSEAEKIALSGSVGEELVPLSANISRMPEETEPTLPPEAETKWIPAPIGEEDANIERMEQIDLAALREVNSDVVGWIMVPNTHINYPLMQGEDNQHYLNHTWNNRSNGAGSIFLDAQNSPDLTDFNTIIYGHNMADMSMFATLLQYSSQWFAENRPYIYIKTDAGVWRYEVFASYNAEVDGKTYALSFKEDNTRLDFLDAALAQSQIDMGINPEITDRIITLSTCNVMGYESRRVVLARLRMIPEK